MNASALYIVYKFRHSLTLKTKIVMPVLMLFVQRILKQGFKNASVPYKAVGDASRIIYILSLGLQAPKLDV